MGQQALILAILSSFLLSMAIFGFMDESNASTQTTTSQFEQEHCLNVANSGVNLALSRLRQNKQWRTGFSNFAVDRGRVTLTVVDVGLDTVRVRSTGTYSGISRTVVALVRLASIFPTVQSALAIYGDSVIFENAGKSFLIDGRDYTADGSAFGTHPPVHGIGIQNDNIDDYLTASLNLNGVAPNVQGSESTPSVGTFDADSLRQLRDLYKSLATRIIPAGAYSGNAQYGTLTSPEIVYIPGDLNWNGTINGAGILVVDGQLELKGKVNWSGIVIAMAGGVTMDLGASGTPAITGTCMIGNENPLHLTTVKVNGNPSVKYSYDAIATVLANLDLLAVKILAYYE